MSQPFQIQSFRGGLNTFDPPTALAPDQVVEATNVEIVEATCGGRRLGHSALTLSATITALTGVFKMHRHLPTSDESAAQLWVMAGTAGVSNTLAFKNDAVWTNQALMDTPVLTAAALNAYRFQSLHGKLFVAFSSAVDRLHVWTGTVFRRVGFDTPVAPTAADTGVGAIAGKRYYRQRYTEQSAGVTLRRSEPSTSLGYTPGGAGLSVRVTKSAALGEGETHWELEASLNNADFYRIATTVVGTTTVDDSTAYATGYASNTLSENVGDYTTVPSGKFLAADNDRLLIGGSWSDTTKASRLAWTPVRLAPGVGNDERTNLSTDPFIDLDGFEGGEMTGLINNGTIYCFKTSHIYRVTRTNQAKGAYVADAISKTTGALAGSIVEGTDPQGRSVIYFVDQKVGACMIGPGGILHTGLDIKTSWDSRITTAADVLVRGVYFPDKRQARWAFTEAGQTATSKGMILHTDKMQITPQGGRRGWTLWTGDALNGVTDMILYSDNVESGAARSSKLVPLISRSAANSHHILISEFGTDDDGTAYAAAIRSRPFILGGGTNQFGIRAAAFIATAAAGVTLDAKIYRDFGVETKTVTAISLAPVGAETHVMPDVDNIFMSEAKAVDIRIADSSPATGTWKLHQVALVPRKEQEA